VPFFLRFPEPLLLDPVIHTIERVGVCDRFRRVVQATRLTAAPPPPPEPRVTNTNGSETAVQFDPEAEPNQALLRANEPAGLRSTLCPPPYRMTASDRCQR
jgi:hypothetical protein